MKVLHLNHADINGGAARAAYRIHHALRASGVDSIFWADIATAGDWTVQAPATKLTKAWAKVRTQIGGLATQLLMRTDNPIIHSPSFVPSGRVQTLNNSDADVVHLHWVQGEMLSIAEISRIKKPIVWTLHDMWAFCGAEHYTEGFRWREGYQGDNRPDYESGFDLNRWTWLRKRKHWQRPMQIITPSHWLADCVRQSALMRDWPVTVVPNCLDTDIWKPIEKSLARQLLGLPPDVPLLLFGAMGGGQDPRKGFDLLAGALNNMGDDRLGLELVVFGQLAPRNLPELEFPVHYTGHLHDDIGLRLLYSAVNALVVPSRQDNLPNTAVEAQACGTPVVAFDIGGLSDIVEHKRTGYLAKAFDVCDLAEGIRSVLGKRESGQLAVQARERALARFSNTVVVKQYRAVYDGLGTQNYK